jgi:hypothetical protein
MRSVRYGASPCFSRLLRMILFCPGSSQRSSRVSSHSDGSQGAQVANHFGSADLEQRQPRDNGWSFQLLRPPIAGRSGCMQPARIVWRKTPADLKKKSSLSLSFSATVGSS